MRHEMLEMYGWKGLFVECELVNQSVHYIFHQLYNSATTIHFHGGQKISSFWYMVLKTLKENVIRFLQHMVKRCIRGPQKNLSSNLWICHYVTAWLAIPLTSNLSSTQVHSRAAWFEADNAETIKWHLLSYLQGGKNAGLFVETPNWIAC